MTNSKTLTPEDFQDMKKRHWTMRGDATLSNMVKCLEDYTRCLDTIEAMQKEIEGLIQARDYYKADATFIREYWNKQNILLTQAEINATDILSGGIGGSPRCSNEMAENDAKTFLSALKKFRGEA